MPRKKKRRAYEDETPTPPDPGYNGAKFLGWIKKQGSLYEFNACKEECKYLNLDLKRFIKEMNDTCIRIRYGPTGRKAKGEPEVLVQILDKTWASKWVRKYKTDMPHHKGWIPLSDKEE